MRDLLIAIITKISYNIYKGGDFMLIDILEMKNITLYQLSKEANIAYSTLENIKLNKVKIDNISCGVLRKLADFFGVSMDIMYKRLSFPKRKEFEWFKSEACHHLKFLGDTAFVLSLIKSDYITTLWDMQWYAESLYLLAMLDILSKKYNAPLYSRYDFYRKQKLANVLYPKDVIYKDKLMPELKYKERILKECNPEFFKYNIVEGDIYDVI